MTVTQEWRHSRINAIFKKGGESMPENFRPISLLPVGNEMLASLLFNRLADGGVEDQLRPSQFGFSEQARYLGTVSKQH
eukprot:4339949-Pyramimonas_sp.AAC.1